MDYFNDKRSRAKVSQDAPGACVKIGDLVKNLTDEQTGVGFVIETDILMWGQAHEPGGVKVLWAHPTWHDPEDGASVMYADELEVISEGR